MSQMLLKPAVADFIELATMTEELALEIEQIELESDASLIGRSLKETQIHAKYDVMVTAIKRSDEQMIFNSSADYVMQAADALIALGSHANLERLEKEANPNSPSWGYHNHRK
jgi:voltage-gated potassium channel